MSVYINNILPDLDLNPEHLSRPQHSPTLLFSYFFVIEIMIASRQLVFLGRWSLLYSDATNVFA